VGKGYFHYEFQREELWRRHISTSWACVMVMLGKLHANIHGTSLLKKIEKSPYQNQESDVGYL
jgi:hypothetical protein